MGDWLDEANLLHAFNDRRMEHVGHPRPHIGVGVETKVGVMRIQQVIGRIVSAGGRLILLADSDALRGLSPFRALHIHDFTHVSILLGRGPRHENPRALTQAYARRKRGA